MEIVFRSVRAMGVNMTAGAMVLRTRTGAVLVVLVGIDSPTYDGIVDFGLPVIVLVPPARRRIPRSAAVRRVEVVRHWWRCIALFSTKCVVGVELLIADGTGLGMVEAKVVSGSFSTQAYIARLLPSFTWILALLHSIQHGSFTIWT